MGGAHAHQIRPAYQAREAEPLDAPAPAAQAKEAEPLGAAAAPPQPLTRQQLLQLGSDFTAAWFGGIRQGPVAMHDGLMQVGVGARPLASCTSCMCKRAIRHHCCLSTCSGQGFGSACSGTLMPLCDP